MSFLMDIKISYGLIRIIIGVSKPLMNGFFILHVGAIFSGQMTHNMVPSLMLSCQMYLCFSIFCGWGENNEVMLYNVGLYGGCQNQFAQRFFFWFSWLQRRKFLSIWCKHLLWTFQWRECMLVKALRMFVTSPSFLVEFPYSIT